MGQYYVFASVEKKECIQSWSYDNGAKLMEHSWLTNLYVGTAMFLISKGQKFYKDHVVWAGDYADNEKDGEKDTGNNLYELCSESNNLIDADKNKVQKLRYIVNLDTKEYVAICKSPVSDVWVDPETKKKYPYCIHPLPLLTCEGNGQGGGDFFGEDPNNLVGKWHRCRVVAQQRKPRNCKELIFDLVEKP